MKKMTCFLLLFLIFIANNLFARTNYLEGNIVIDKNSNYSGDWEIKEGTKILIKSNIRCVFSGNVKVTGKKARRVIIGGEQNSSLVFNGSRDVAINYADISGMEVVEFSESNARISNTDFSGNKLAVRFVKNTKALLSNCVFKNNEIALVSELKSLVEIDNISFLKNQKAVIASQAGLIKLKNSEFKKNNIGCYINNDGQNFILNNQFIDNEAAIVLHQNSNTEIYGNNFFKNKVGIYAEIMSRPLILNNKFSDNGTAVKFVQFVDGAIRENSFFNNDTAVFLEKKSNPLIRQNTFKNSSTAVFCDFSSYPIITLNDFLDNKLHIKLGIYQSADFENRVGSIQIQLNEAMAKETRRTLDFNKQRKFFVGELFAKKNYWDEKTIKEMETKENVSTIYDGHDLPETKYEGYGEDKYKLDVVIFKPFLRKPVNK